MELQTRRKPKGGLAAPNRQKVLDKSGVKKEEEDWEEPAAKRCKNNSVGENAYVRGEVEETENINQTFFFPDDPNEAFNILEDCMLHHCLTNNITKEDFLRRMATLARKFDDYSVNQMSRWLRGSS